MFLLNNWLYLLNNWQLDKYTGEHILCILLFRSIDTGEAGGTSSATILWSKNLFFIRKIGVDEREGVGKENWEKWHRKERVQPEKWFASHKFFYEFLFVTQSSLLGFSWSSDNITESYKENTLKSLSVHLR